MIIKPTIEITDSIAGVQILAARPEGYKLKNGYDMGALDSEEIKLVLISRQRMSEYIAFSELPGIPRDRQNYFQGAAAAINDFMCVIGYGAAVEDLTDRLNHASCQAYQESSGTVLFSTEF